MEQKKILYSKLSMPTTVLEPIGAGLAVALINKFIINNHSLWAFCSGPRQEYVEHEEECTSSSSTTTTDAVEVHAHLF